jgi:hypothetical protein
MDHKWKQLILGVNFFYGFRVNEPPNETLYWILTSPSFAVYAVLIQVLHDPTFST